MSLTPNAQHTQNGEFLLVHLSPSKRKYAMALSHVVKISSNQQHQSERMFTIVRIFVGAVTAGTANKFAERFTTLLSIDTIE